MKPQSDTFDSFQQLRDDHGNKNEEFLYLPLHKPETVSPLGLQLQFHQQQPLALFSPHYAIFLNQKLMTLFYS